MNNQLKIDYYFVSPLEVVKVTSENMQEVAAWCGGQVHTVESRRVKGRVDEYVWVPCPAGTQLSWAFAGMFITKRLVVSVKGELKETYAVFRREYFDKNYFETPNEAVEKTWERQQLERQKAKRKNAVTIDEILEKGTVTKNGVTYSLVDSDTGEYVIRAESSEPEEKPAREVTDVELPTDLERETPHSPLKEPREAEKHEEIAEESAELTEEKFNEEVAALILQDEGDEEEAEDAPPVEVEPVPEDAPPVPTEVPNEVPAK